ncbi:retrovirus-related pol polyprotein from transposon TNT 1-94 [Tanacetum coccineum]|uniref:Retrovirus-related pol polyprotein from transposon TNT 1-94 n=1 Tax=Tanacetum coccineum TaxID=301880 RepID=A0ABQ4XT38_9ASTR
MTICDQMRMESIKTEQKYALVIVTITPGFWMGKDFLRTKMKLFKTDNGTEFRDKNTHGWFDECWYVLMKRAYLGPSTTERDVERRNANLLYGSLLVTLFSILRKLHVPLAEAVATACYTLNRSLVHMHHGKHNYELLKGKKPNLQLLSDNLDPVLSNNDYDDV